MKIKFANPYSEDVYEIVAMHHYNDAEGRPVDIIIVGAKDVLEEIGALHGPLGNIRANDYLDYFPIATESSLKDTYTALYARLDEFTVECERVTYE